MYINKADLDTLIEIEQMLFNRNMVKWFRKLYEINDRLIQDRNKTNQKIRTKIAEKRKLDKNYARSKKDANIQ
jgi:hypothetical protein